MIHEISKYVYLYGYLAIFLFIFLQEIGIPIPVPNELLLLFSGYLVFKKVLILSFLLPYAISADLLGTMTLYSVFYFSGDFLLKHKPAWFPLSQKRIERLRHKLTLGGWLTIYACRVTPLIRGYTSVAAGLLHLRPKKYFLVAFGSSFLVCTFYILLGYFAGPWYNAIVETIKSVKDYLFVGILCTIAFFVAKMLIHNRNDRTTQKAKDQYISDGIVRLHVVSETAWVTQGQGVHTAFIELNELLADEKRLIISVNEDGRGNILHSHTYGPYYFWKGLRYKGRRILTAHVIPDSSKGTLPYWKQLLPLTTRYLKLAYSFADIVIAISPTVENELIKLDVKSKIVRIYNPILTENWRRTVENRNNGRAILKVGQGELVVLGVGQLQERKGVEDFIDMASAMPEYKFVWVGGRPWGKFTEGVKRIDARIEMAPANIHFTGLIDLKDMPSMYAAADIFVFPSYQENCPLAPHEAAASGLPVIYRDIPEYEALYQTPYLKAKSTAEFNALIGRLAKDSYFYDEAVGFSNKLVQAFDKNKVKSELLDLYRSTLDNYFNTCD
jgi:1,2-diacylglycerol-3-alpha-glucose alpha-1,2-galactosyltransferase